MRWTAHSFISFKNIEKIELSSILKLVSNICKSIPDLLVYLGSSFKSSLNPFFAGGGGVKHSLSNLLFLVGKLQVSLFLPIENENQSRWNKKKWYFSKERVKLPLFIRFLELTKEIYDNLGSQWKCRKLVAKEYIL